MRRVWKSLARERHAAVAEFRLEPRQALLIQLAPLFVFGAWAVLLVSSWHTRQLAFWLLRENHPVELATFALLLAAAARCALLARHTRRLGQRGASVFHGVFAAGLFFVAGEEVAWGQWLFGFATPAWLAEINAQGEVTLHNLEGLQGHSEVWRICFGAGGLIGVWMAGLPRMRAVAAPALLVPWFVVILGHACVDLWNDVVPFASVLPRGDALDWAMTRTAELNELVIAGAALAYAWLKSRQLHADPEAVLVPRPATRSGSRAARAREKAGAS